MRRLLNTLYVTSQGAYLHRERETVVVTVDGEVRTRMPIHTLQGIVCFGQVSMSPPLMGLCAERQVRVSFLSRTGRFWARVEGPVSGNVLLRREQYRRAENSEASAEIARAVVIAKLSNSRVVLLRALRSNAAGSGGEALDKAAVHLATSLENLGRPQPLDSVRGIEGEASREYFSVFDDLIVAQKDDFFFRERSRRPPLDNMNSLLSFLYTLLMHDVASAVESVGLDPAVGFLHRDRPGRPGLALDLMEELRPYLADRLALSLVNLRQIAATGFVKTDTGAILMDETTRKEIIVAYQSRKQEEIRHPFLGEKVAVGLLPYIQSLLLARHLRGDIDGYPPFFWK